MMKSKTTVAGSKAAVPGSLRTGSAGSSSGKGSKLNASHLSHPKNVVHGKSGKSC